MKRISTSEAADFVSTEEAGRLLGLDPSMVRRYAASGDLAGVKVGRAWIFARAVVASFAPREPGRPPKLTAKRSES